ncbi:MAG: RagB/SusD family nutrient uptake outer membrane protein [Prolixibacteraceae bacterium]|jgi:tetratricopeptide (TPR) repeat protein|nr:RagB/SusD family nutrient uptake outer membrane protein [Prolixibacteraceae bacterium]
MKKYILIVLTLLFSLNSCVDFLTLQPEYQINENTFYENASDYETALVGTYSTLQGLHNTSLLYLAELTTDNAEITWSGGTISQMECDQMNLTPTNEYVYSTWNSCFTTISRCNNILTRIENADIDITLKSQYKGESLFLRAYCYFYLVRLFGDLPLIKVAFRSPNEIAAFDMSRKPVSEIYNLIIADLKEAANLLSGVAGLEKSRASVGASKALLGKVYLTQKEYALAAISLKEVIDMNKYSLTPNYKTLFTNGNDDLAESIFEIKYIGGNVGEGNSFSSLFTPFIFDMAIFPGNMAGSGIIIPTHALADTYEPDDLRRGASIADSIKLKNGSYGKNLYGLKFVDFTTGIQGDGSINFTSIRYADVLLMYAEALNETNKTTEALTYMNMIRARAGLAAKAGLSKADFTLSIEKERQLEFLCEGARWFDLVRTGRAKTVMNKYFSDHGLKFTVEDYELLMPIPQKERDINPILEQNSGY